MPRQNLGLNCVCKAVDVYSWIRELFTCNFL